MKLFVSVRLVVCPVNLSLQENEVLCSNSHLQLSSASNEFVCSVQFNRFAFLFRLSSLSSHGTTLFSVAVDHVGETVSHPSCQGFSQALNLFLLQVLLLTPQALLRPPSPSFPPTSYHPPPPPPASCRLYSCSESAPAHRAMKACHCWRSHATTTAAMPLCILQALWPRCCLWLHSQRQRQAPCIRATSQQPQMAPPHQSKYR